MIHSYLIILYCVISITGGLIYFLKNSPNMQFGKLISLLIFISSHTYFMVLGILHVFINVHLIWVSFAIVLVFISRISNGLVLFGKNNWKHYIVTGALMGTILVLHLYNY
ncbi:hypothetical protein [Virgibacillus ndiopensis]|uniref:hypothetical protein n=1 Tax=Virgibacillus ndiopensis TaxID=2004408 RepID=UPI000C06FF6A|nr:hypothetical protein [Virgibacillus ndiopensis]